MNGKLFAAALAAGALMLSPAFAASKKPIARPALKGAAASAAAEIGVLPPLIVPSLGLPEPVPACVPGSEIRVGSGTICGLDGGPLADGTDSGTYAYKGIQYATAARWRAPQAVVPRAGAATAFGKECPNDKVPLSATDEQCLYLNVWRPKTAAASSLPVMVFIHGGAFFEGSASKPTYDGRTLANQNVIVVTLNYRLGALGFLDTGGFQIHGIRASGNYGILDQQEALKWVRTYISAFGGNPNQVTIFGESAGAMSVGLHVFDAPGSAGLFRAAISESDVMGEQYLTPAEAKDVAIPFLVALCNGVQDCANVSVSNILAHQLGFLSNSAVADDLIARRRVGLRTLPWGPVIDGQVLVGQPYAGYARNAAIRSVPLVLGVNRDEGVPFGALVWSAISNGSSTDPEQTMKTLYEAVVITGLDNGLAPFELGLANGRYNPSSSGTDSPYYGKHAAMMANVITDFLFSCGNAAAADVTVARSPVFAYLFNQPSIYDPPGAEYCGKASGNVCHAAELPYVFGTLAPPAQGQTVPAADAALSRQMVGAWASFAKNPSAPGSPWTAYRSGGEPATVFASGASGSGTIDPFGVCHIWRDFKPALFPPPAR